VLILKARKMILCFLIAALCLGSLAACTANGTTSPEKASAGSKKDSILNVALSTNLPTLDPTFSTSTVTLQIAPHIFETLFAYDENYKSAPMLAEGAKISDDGLTTTITLRKGVKFHNGKEMSADDVVASLNRWKEVSPVAKATFTTVTGITAKDSSTVEIKSSKPSGVIITALATPRQPAVIMPKEIAEKAGKKELEETVGTGPFKLVEWKHDQNVHITRFDEYQPLSTPPKGLSGKKEALVKDIFFHFVTNAASRIAGLQSGDYDFVADVSVDNYETLKADPNIQLYIGKPSRMNYLFFNNKAGVFANLKMREAVNTALDLDAIMQAVAAKPEFYRIDPGLMFEEQKDWYVTNGKEMYNQKNKEKAKSLLKEAGYNGEKVTLLISKEHITYNSALVVAEELKDLGMNVNVENYDWPTVLERRKDPAKWDIFFTGTGISAHPTEVNFLDSRKNYPGFYKNEEVDKLMDQLMVTVDPAAAKEIFRQIQTLYLKDVPTIKLGDLHILTASNKKVKNFNYFYELNFWNVSVE
jgi:peptide/nickel transport system substrate-binding protein